MQELDVPLRATVTLYSDTDHVGRLVLDDGQEVRFGRTACADFVPAVGASVFVTALAPHPLGGLKASKIRDRAVTEAVVRTEHEQQVKRAAEATAAELERRRAELTPLLTSDVITARVMASLMPDEDYDADERQLYFLCEELEIVGHSLIHVAALVRAISDSPALAHFGSPGPIVHYMERVSGYEDVVYDAAESAPRMHFMWLLARIAKSDHGDEAIAILRGWKQRSDLDPTLRENVTTFLATLDT